MHKDVLSFKSVRVDADFLHNIWTLDPRTLDNVDGKDLSSYALALSQYLVYFTYQRNKARAEQHRLTKYIDRRVALIMAEDPSYLKKYKTKGVAADNIIISNSDLIENQTKLENIQFELMEIDGIDKSISELISTIKRELTRRENELYQVRMERRN